MLSEKQKAFYDLVVYQIYPRSFLDTNGDGVGDLQGVREKLDYIQSLGANAIWLTPCYKSPNEDNGYDIADYTDIAEEYGTLEDWKALVADMHSRGMKIIMDFVANHTSAEHRWFRESRKSKDNPYRDYYYWADQPLNDWNSTFGGSAWQYDEATKQYYLHSYAVGQPDLNWENPKVREEMAKIIDFWVDLGVDGFRCDVLDQISKDFVNNQNRLGPHLHEYIQFLFGREKTKHLFTVGECWGADEANIKLFVDGDRDELSCLFQFDHMLVGYTGQYYCDPFTLDDVRDVLVRWQNNSQKNELLYTLFFENHDRPRSVSRFGNEQERRYESATMLATMLFLQKGVPFIFQGQEIGVTNSCFDSIDAFDDIEAKNFYRANLEALGEEEVLRRLNFGSRDNARHPMPWDENSGSAKSWIVPYSRGGEIHVKHDLSSEKSIYRFYQQLFVLRKDVSAFRHGTYEDLTNGREGMYLYSRTLGVETYLVVCNFDKERPLSFEKEGKVFLSNMGRSSISGVYAPYECAVFQL